MVLAFVWMDLMMRLAGVVFRIIQIFPGFFVRLAFKGVSLLYSGVFSSESWMARWIFCSEIIG